MTSQHRASPLTIAAFAMIALGAYAAGIAMRPATASELAPTTAPAETDAVKAAGEAADALLDWLQVSRDQRAKLLERDPNFADDLARLRTDRTTRRTELAATLDDPNVSDQRIRTAVDAALAADAAVERRVVDFLLAARGHLDARQQRDLLSLCADGVRRGAGMGPGWRAAAGAGRGPGPGGGPGRGGRGGGGGPPWMNRSTAPASQPSASSLRVAPTTQPQTADAVDISHGPVHDVIFSLLGQHKLIQRDVRELPDGTETVTTSSDPAVAALIRVHVRQMKSRLEAGWLLRGFDPLFRELFRHHDKIVMKIEDVDGGVKVVETSTDPQVAMLIRQHATAAVSEFVRDGMARMHEPTPLPAGYRGTADTGR